MRGSKRSQTNQARQQAGDQNNKERLRNPDSGKEATLSLSRTGGGETGPGLWVRACLARTIFVLSGGVGTDEIPAVFHQNTFPLSLGSMWFKFIVT